MDEKNIKAVGVCIKAYPWAFDVEVVYCNILGSDRCGRDTNCEVYRNHLLDKALHEALKGTAFKSPEAII